MLRTAGPLQHRRSPLPEARHRPARQAARGRPGAAAGYGLRTARTSDATAQVSRAACGRRGGPQQGSSRARSGRSGSCRRASSVFPLTPPPVDAAHQVGRFEATEPSGELCLCSADTEGRNGRHSVPRDMNPPAEPRASATSAALRPVRGGVAFMSGAAGWPGPAAGTDAAGLCAGLIEPDGRLGRASSGGVSPLGYGVMYEKFSRLWPIVMVVRVLHILGRDRHDTRPAMVHAGRDHG